ncbi:MAG: hypothetical protein EBY84_06360, partial [Acidimicrobiia bacterium]|nr:hypothetical protein [Acidimicrobiia bacterium]
QGVDDEAVGECVASIHHVPRRSIFLQQTFAHLNQLHSSLVCETRGEFGEGDRDDWAVHIALWQRSAGSHGELTDAAVALPGLGLTLSTSPAPQPPARQERTPLMVVSRSRTPAVAAAVAQELGFDGVRLGSAGAKTMAVVLGNVDVYLHAGGQYQWDSAAPIAVARAAGLHTSRIDGSPLVYNERDTWLPDLLVCQPHLADDILQAVRNFTRN